ncbi:hypothetical protein JS44_12320 [Anoxybacillus flavithermus]|uniref:Uncharacterized protein n=1 Tax=Anoxybacillus flavithermus TaxID=33934 RepID=A0A094J2M8_9BACL|nr:hypothetical protein JS44_12320 [Anoxybacillus flavithermus]
MHISFYDDVTIQVYGGKAMKKLWLGTVLVGVIALSAACSNSMQGHDMSNMHTKKKQLPIKRICLWQMIQRRYPEKRFT